MVKPYQWWKNLFTTIEGKIVIKTQNIGIATCQKSVNKTLISFIIVWSKEWCIEFYTICWFNCSLEKRKYKFISVDFPIFLCMFTLRHLIYQLNLQLKSAEMHLMIFFINSTNFSASLQRTFNQSWDFCPVHKHFSNSTKWYLLYW